MRCATIIAASFLILLSRVQPTFNRANKPRDYPFYFLWHHENSSFSKQYVHLAENTPSLQDSFFEDHPKEKWKSHSQQDSQQDILVTLLLKDKSRGFFVDLAANHFKARSNSYNVEQYNDWNGLCIEPNPIYLIGLLSNRKCIIFVNPVSGATNELVKFRFHHDGLFGGIVGSEFDNKDGTSSNSSSSATPIDVSLYTVTLEQLLDFVEAPKIVDYLSLDVEGAEEITLRHFKFSKYVFTMITVERPNQRLHSLLSFNGYLFVYTLKGGFGDCLYVHHTIEDVHSIMRKYHSPTRIPGWDRHHRPYLLEPSWNSSIYNINRNSSLY